MDMLTMNFTGARLQEVRGGETIHAWVLRGRVNENGNVGLTVMPDGGGVGAVMFYPEFWETHLNYAIRTAIFTRKRPNGDPAQFPHQPHAETTGVSVMMSATEGKDWMTRAEQRQRLSKFNLANASVVECWSTGRSEDWRVRQCEIGTGALENITLRLGLHGKGETSVVLYDGFWAMQLNPDSRSVYFRRLRPNGDPKEFADQPDELVTGYMVRWKK